MMMMMMMMMMMTYLSLLAFNASPSLHIHTPPATSLPGGTGERRLGAGGHALVSGCPEHWTIQPST